MVSSHAILAARRSTLARHQASGLAVLLCGISSRTPSPVGKCSLQIDSGLPIPNILKMIIYSKVIGRSVAKKKSVSLLMVHSESNTVLYCTVVSIAFIPDLHIRAVAVKVSLFEAREGLKLSCFSP